jgi:hypothetical protein
VKHPVGILSLYLTLAQYTPRRLKLHKPRTEIEHEAERRVWQLFQTSTRERVAEIQERKAARERNTVNKRN